MMRRGWTWLAVAAVLSAPSWSEDASPFKDRVQEESYAIGAQTGRTLKKDMAQVDVDLLIRGLRDGLGGGSLLLSGDSLHAVMSRVQQELHKNMVLNRRALAEKNKEEGARILAENASKPGVATTASGLQYRVLKAGEGRKPMLNNTVLVNYRGTLPNGVGFDASPDGKPAQWVVVQAMTGLKEALQLMQVGAKFQVWVPANLAYGDRGMGTDVGPNQVLQFEIELAGIK